MTWQPPPDPAGKPGAERQSDTDPAQEGSPRPEFWRLAFWRADAQRARMFQRNDPWHVRALRVLLLLLTGVVGAALLLAGIAAALAVLAFGLLAYTCGKH